MNKSDSRVPPIVAMLVGAILSAVIAGVLIKGSGWQATVTTDNTVTTKSEETTTTTTAPEPPPGDEDGLLDWLATADCDQLTSRASIFPTGLSVDDQNRLIGTWNTRNEDLGCGIISLAPLVEPIPVNDTDL